MKHEPKCNMSGYIHPWDCPVCMIIQKHVGEYSRSYHKGYDKGYQEGWNASEANHLDDYSKGYDAGYEEGKLWITNAVK